MMSRIIVILKYQWPLKVLSVVLAVSLWAYVRENPPIRKQLRMPVTFINRPHNLVVLSTQPEEFEVTVQSQRRSISESGLSNISLVADLSSAHVGQQQVMVEAQGVPDGVEVIFYKRTVTVTLDKLVSDERPVIAELRGLPAEGYRAQAAQVRPNLVTVSGASSRVRSVERVVAVADISGYSATAQLQSPVEARDERNVVIGDLAVQPDKVQVTVPITKLTTQTVLIKPNLSNPPAGYQVTSAQTSPNTVAITGDADKLTRLEYLSTERIDISHLRRQQTFTVNIDFPEGIESMGVGAVSVTVTVQRLPTPEETEPETGPGEPPGTGEEPGPQPETEETEPAPPTPSDADSSSPSPQ